MRAISALVRLDAEVVLLHLIVMIMHSFQALLFRLSVMFGIGHKSSIQGRVHGRLSSGVCVQKRYGCRRGRVVICVVFLRLDFVFALRHDARVTRLI